MKKEKISAKKEPIENNSETKAEGKKRFKPTKKMLAIIASVCAVLIIAAVAIPIGIIFGNKKTVPAPYFVDFNEEKDYYIRIRWNKIRGANAYSYVYCYGNPEETDESNYVEGRTQNTVTSVPRHKGIVAFRVKAEITGENTSYSEWVKLDVTAWKLEKPIVTITDKMSVSWVASTFKADDKTYDVKSYACEILIDGESVLEDFTVSSSSIEFGNFIYKALGNEEKVQNYNLYGTWTDITITVKVKALAYELFAGSPITTPQKPYDVLLNVYEDSDYYEQTVTITEDIYNGLK